MQFYGIVPFIPYISKKTGEIASPQTVTDINN